MLTTKRPIASAAAVFGALPELREEPGARERIRAARAATGRRIAVLDDDPTGSQSVYDVNVVTRLEAAEYAAGLRDRGSTCFILTNIRSLPEDTAVELTSSIGHDLFTLAARLGTRPWTSSAAVTRHCVATSSPRCTRWTQPGAVSPVTGTTVCCSSRPTSKPGG